MLFLLCQQPWRGAVWGPLSLSQGEWDDSVPAFPYTQVTPLPRIPHMEPRRRVASGIVCLHKGQRSLSAPDMAPWPRPQLYPLPSPELGLLTEPVGRIPLEQRPQEALGFRAQKLGHA